MKHTSTFGTGLACLALLTLGCSLLSGQASNPFTAAWKGRASQHNPSGDWPVEVQFSPDTGIGTVTYPSLGCGGTLTPENIADNAATFIETIEYGSNCVAKGRYYFSSISNCQVSVYYESLTPEYPDNWAQGTLASTSAVTSPGMGPTCGDPDFLDASCPSDANYHAYSTATRLCAATTAGCTRTAVFNLMVASKQRVVPNTTETDAVISCSTINLRIPFVDFVSSSTIKASVQPDQFRIVIYTPPNHALYPGRVSRTIREQDGFIVVETVGDGTGLLPTLNKLLAPMVWQSVDSKLKQAVDTAVSNP